MTDKWLIYGWCWYWCCDPLQYTRSYTLRSVPSSHGRSFFYDDSAINFLFWGQCNEICLIPYKHLCLPFLLSNYSPPPPPRAAKKLDVEFSWKLQRVSFLTFFLVDTFLLVCFAKLSCLLMWHKNVPQNNYLSQCIRKSAAALWNIWAIQIQM